MMINNSSVQIQEETKANDDFQISINHLLIDYVGRVSIVFLFFFYLYYFFLAEDT